MTDIIEYIDNNTALYSIEFDYNFECYLLLLDSFSDWANIFAEYLMNLKVMKISKSKDKKNPFYFACNTFNDNLKIDPEISDKSLINTMCQTHFSEKTFLIKDRNNKFYINFNLDSIIKNTEKTDYTIFGILLNPLEGLIKYFEDNQNNLLINKVDKYSNITISSIVINDDVIQNEENQNNEGANQEENKENEISNEDQEEQNEVEELEDDELAENFDKEFEVENNLNLDEQDQIPKKRRKIRSSSLEEELMEDKGTRRGRKRDQIDENKAREEVTKFMAKMREAKEIDDKSMARNQPAIEKLKLLNTIQKFLSNYLYQKIFLEYNGLELLQDWIKKNQDGSYPVFNQLSVILDVLSSLNISVTNLRNCSIGSYVMDLKQMKESRPIFKKASEIVEKWSRIVWDINTNYSDIDLENKHYKSVFSNKKRIRDINDDGNDVDKDDKKKNEENSSNFSQEKKPNKNLLSSNVNIYSHAKVPKKALFDFTIKPQINESDIIKGPSILKSKFIFGEKKRSGRNKSE